MPSDRIEPEPTDSRWWVDVRGEGCHLSGWVADWRELAALGAALDGLPVEVMAGPADWPRPEPDWVAAIADEGDRAAVRAVLARRAWAEGSRPPAVE
jgi:hypothetical protein